MYNLYPSRVVLARLTQLTYILLWLTPVQSYIPDLDFTPVLKRKTTMSFTPSTFNQWQNKHKFKSSCADINTVSVSDADINSAKCATFYTSNVWYTDS